jgi:hypothetical protein
LKKTAEEDKAAPTADEEDDLPKSHTDEYRAAALQVVYKQMDTQDAWEKQHATNMHAMNAEAGKLHLDHAISQEG